MADPRQWPGFCVKEPEHWKRNGGGRDSVRGAERDVTYPQSLVNRAKKPVEKANEALMTAAGDPLTQRQANLRRALARGEMSSLDPTQHIVAQSIRMMPGGRKEFLAMIQRASRNNDPDALAWWNVFMDLLPVDQQRVDLDLICEAAGVTPDRLMAVVVSTSMRAGADVAELVAAVSYPRLVRQTTKSAMRIGGEFATIAQKDREFMLQHNKFIAAPKSGSVFVSASANASAAAAAQSQPSVPTFRESLEGAMGAHKAVQGEIIDAATFEED